MRLNLLFISVCLLGFFSCQKSTHETVNPSLAQATEDNLVKGLEVVEGSELTELERGLIAEGLVDIKSVIPEVYVDLKYSTTNNFFGQDVYGDLLNCYLQPEVAQMLLKAHVELKRDRPDLTFLIYDGVRPLSVQQILWDNLDKPEDVKPLYVADPKIGGLHNYGVAVDLTLAYQATGEALDMGTPYDYFGYPAYPDREKQMLKEGKITQDHINNREILRNAMFHAGFMGIGSEWWHFNAFSRVEAAKKYMLVP
jgi:zinc D-Ala-D-Ala dipeptidase